MYHLAQIAVMQTIEVYRLRRIAAFHDDFGDAHEHISEIIFIINVT